MKRLALCLALLLSAGCMMHEDSLYEESVWYEAPSEHFHACQPGPGYSAVPISPRIVPPGPGILPTRGTIPPPPAPPQTREPDLLSK